MSQVIEKDWGRQVQMDDGTVINIIKNRRLYVLDEDFSLNADSLVGSAFLVLVGDEIVWQGVIVAEPEAGRYLCELDKLTEGAMQVQRVFSLDTLMGLGDEAKRLLEGSMAEAKAPIVEPYIEWRLYDSVEAAQEAFHTWRLPQADLKVSSEGEDLPALEDWPVQAEDKPEAKPKKPAARKSARRAPTKRKGVN